MAKPVTSRAGYGTSTIKLPGLNTDSLTLELTIAELRAKFAAREVGRSVNGAEVL